MIINVKCPGCELVIEHESVFTVRIGDRFTCTCGKNLCLTKLGEPALAEVIQDNKYSTIKDKK